MIYQGSTGERKRLFKKLQREIRALQRKKSREPAAVIPLPKSKPKPSLPLNDNAASIEYFTLQLEQAKANKAYNDETAIRANKLKQLTGSHNAPSLELIK